MGTHRPLCTILRGIPGSGKTSWAVKQYPKAVICSADHLFTDANGKYNFDPKYLSWAHEQCFERFRIAVKWRRDVVIDNVNAKLEHYSMYFAKAVVAGYDIDFVEFILEPEKAWLRGRHHVPLEKINAICDSFEPIPPLLREFSNVTIQTIEVE